MKQRIKMTRSNDLNSFVVKAGLGSGPQSADTKLEVEFIASQLQLERGARILDLPCGNGRHALGLAQKDYLVTAVDVSKVCIEAARTMSQHPNIDYKMQNLNDIEKVKLSFNAVISPLSCIGYFPSDKDNLLALRRLTSVLQDRGRFMLSTANCTFVRKLGNNTRVFDNGGYVIERTDKYDASSKYLERWFKVLDKNTGKRRSYFHRRRLYSKTEFVKLLRSCDIGSIKCFADFNGTPFSGNRSPHAIYIGTKLAQAVR